MNISEKFDQINELSILVIGDVMLDSYQYGNVDRISPEAPVPIIHLQKTENRLGGAANVALNCKSLGTKVTLAATIGNDEAGEIICSLLNQEGIDSSLILKDNRKPTTSKTRIISKNHQIIRIDKEDNAYIHSEVEHPFLDKVLKYIQMYKPNIVILEDYNKGLLKENIIQRIIAHANNYGAVIAVDPKFHEFFSYKNVTIFKPNLKEIQDALQITDTSTIIQNLPNHASELRKKINATHLLITLSDRGIYFNNENEEAILPTHPRNIIDVSGAGDTVIAVAAIFYALTADIKLSVSVANLAGGIVCESVGVVPVDKEKLKKEIKLSFSS